MSRRRKGRDVNGILVIDKPQGVTSNGILQQVKRLYGAAKAGHTGALDPLAACQVDERELRRHCNLTPSSRLQRLGEGAIGSRAFRRRVYSDVPRLSR